MAESFQNQGSVSFYANADQPSFLARPEPDGAATRLAEALKEQRLLPLSIETRTAFKTVAEDQVRSNVVTERLGGDERLFKRWRSNNEGYFDYRVRLAQAEIDGTTAGVAAVDETLRSKAVARPWRAHGANSVISPAGVVMSHRQARLLGWQGESQ